MNTDPKSVVTRIPPSPTGHLHIGTARTALFNYLFAKQHGGSMLFRSEDTDHSRSDRSYETEIQDGLRWLGITWDNETILRQSEQGAVYTEAIEQLIAADAAYISEEPSKQDPSQTVSVVRLRNPNTTITFTDLIRGEIAVDTTDLGDFVIARSIDDALYHLTVVVDDERMGVTHVLRGEDHISNTPRQILILEALGYTRPIYAHLPLILAPDRSKMSKRNSVVAIRDYQDMGILPETLVNYIALLGWNPGTDQEVFTMNDLIAQFSIDDVQKGGAVFDIDKLKWLNKKHLERAGDAEQTAYVLDTVRAHLPDLAPENMERMQRLVLTILERSHTKQDIVTDLEAGEYDFALSEPTVPVEMVAWKKDSDVQAALPRLQHVQTLLETADFSSPDTIKAAIWPYAEETGRGEVLWPLRVALTGQAKSPDPFTVAYALGAPTAIARIEAVCAKIEAS